MAILQHFPLKSSIKDYRDRKSYYVGKCEWCGGDFYPHNKNAMYCCAYHGTLAKRKRDAEKPQPIVEPKVVKQAGKVIKTERKKVVKSSQVRLVGKRKVINYLSSKCKVHGLLKELNGCSVGDAIKWKNFIIVRNTSSSYLIS
jgi:hypothetical protein